MPTPGDYQINSTEENKNTSCLLKPEDYHKTVLPWLYLLLNLLGFLGNGLVVLDLRRSEKTPTVIFTLNIVASDLMLCCSLPFRVAYYTLSDGWESGTGFCGTITAVMISCLYINLYCNMSFLLSVSINRYATVVRLPWKFLNAFKQPPFCWSLCLVTWIAVGTLVIASVAYEEHLKTTGPKPNSCFDQVVNHTADQRGIHSIGVGLFLFMMVLMLISYSLLVFHLQRVSRTSLVGAGFGPGGGLRVKRKIVASMVIFTACFLPYHVQRLKIITSTSQDCEKQQKDFSVKTLMILIAALGCCLHPALHLTMHLPCCRPKRNVRTKPDVSPHTHTNSASQT